MKCYYSHCIILYSLAIINTTSWEFNHQGYSLVNCILKGSKGFSKTPLNYHDLAIFIISKDRHWAFLRFEKDTDDK